MIQRISVSPNYNTAINYNLSNSTNSNKNYCKFDKDKADLFISRKESALPYMSEILLHSRNEEQIVETLYIIDRMLENKVNDIDKMYYIFSRFNSTNSPYIQTYLAGIYRKLQIPDAFGPLVNMLIKNSQHPNSIVNFDPNEEIGGAILSYISDKFRDY